MIIDCHAHIFTDKAALNKDAWTIPKAQATIEDYRKVLKKSGIHRAVLAASSLHADGNAYSMAACRADRNIRTTVIITPDTAQEELEAFDQSGACGIRLQLRNKAIPDLRMPAYQRLLRRISDLGWHIQLHDDSHRLPAMIEIIEASGVPLVIDHFGRPGPEGPVDEGFRAVLAAVERGRTWVKVSAAFRLPAPVHDRALAQALLAIRGADRILWGSDWPFVGFEDSMTYGRALADFARAVPDPAIREAIGNTAAQFYFGAGTGTGG